MSPHHENTWKNKRGSSPSALETMLNDDEALEGVEAWLNQQALLIKLTSPQTARPAHHAGRIPGGLVAASRFACPSRTGSAKKGRRLGASLSAKHPPCFL